MRISIFGHLLAPAAASPPRLVYRLRHWPERLPPHLHTADVLRALSVMSNRPVHREWLLHHSNLKPAALDGLVDLLSSRGDLEVLDTSRFPASAL